MQTTAAYGLYPDPVEVKKVVDTLNDAGFDDENMCLMFSPAHPVATIVREANILNEKRASAATAEMIGWLSGFGAVVIPSVGFFVRSRAFLQALVTAREAPSLCGSSRTLAALGFPGPGAERLSAELQETGFLVYVVATEAARVRWALELLRSSGAHESATLVPELDTAAVA